MTVYIPTVMRFLGLGVALRNDHVNAMPESFVENEFFFSQVLFRLVFEIIQRLTPERHAHNVHRLDVVALVPNRIEDLHSSRLTRRQTESEVGQKFSRRAALLAITIFPQFNKFDLIAHASQIEDFTLKPEARIFTRTQ